MTEDERIEIVYLKPGEFFFSERPARVTTVLGSCVAITMFGKGGKKACAVSHNLLASCGKGRHCGEICREPFRYVDCTVRLMLGKFARLGIGPRELEVKLFGGSDMFPTDAGLSVGAENIKTALASLAGAGLVPAAMDVGGNHGRKIIFSSLDGSVLLKRLKAEESDEVCR